MDAHAVASYVLTNDFGKVLKSKHRRWARAFLRSVKRTIRRLRRSHFFGFEATTHFPYPKTRHCRRATMAERAVEHKQEKGAQGPKRIGTFKYGLEVPRNWKDLLRIDTEAGNRKWQEAVENEVAALIMHGCFDFKPPDYKPSGEYQYCRLHFVYEVKTDLRQKVRLVFDGSRVDP